MLVQVNIHGRELNLIVEDDGKGFDLKKVDVKGGLGLKSVQSRINYLKGSFDIDSIIGEGTTFSIQVDL